MRDVGPTPSASTDTATVQYVGARFILGAAGVAQPPAGTPWGLYLPLSSS